MSAISEKTKKIIADTLGVNETALTPETDLIKDLGADSLDVVELVSILEKEFKVSIPDEKIERMKKVNHFTEHFEKVRPFPDSYYYATNAA
jgi:acyl carrier protein